MGKKQLSEALLRSDEEEEHLAFPRLESLLKLGVRGKSLYIFSM
jgi:hypothetical protein